MIGKVIGWVVFLFSLMMWPGETWAQSSSSTYPCRTGSSASTEKDGCVDPVVRWQFVRHENNVPITRIFDDKYSAAQMLLALHMQNNIDSDIDSIKSAPITYKSYVYSCANPSTYTDDDYTTYSYGSDRTFFYVEAFGWRDVSWCGGVQEYVKTTVGGVSANVSCPLGYSRYRPVSDNKNEPFGYVCVPSHSLDEQSPGCEQSYRNPEGSCSTQNPVQIASRQKMESVVDLATSGPWPIVWSRSYNSGSNMLWQFDQKKVLYTSISSTGIARAFLRGPSGTRVAFKTSSVATSTGEGVVWVKNMGTMSGLVDARLSHDFSDGLFTYHVVDRNGTKEKYRLGKLIEKENSQGYKHFYSYDEFGRLVKIEDDFGHYVSVSYTANRGLSSALVDTVSYLGEQGGERQVSSSSLSYFQGSQNGYLSALGQIKSVSDGSRQVNYEWGDAISGSSPAKYYLLSVSDSDGESVSYTYKESTNGHSNGTNMLTGKWDGEGRRTNTYDYGGSTSNTVVKEWKGGDVNAVGAKETIDIGISSVLDQNGNAFTYTKDVYLLKMKTISAKCPWCMPSLGQLKKAYTYDAAGNPISLTDFNNNVETRTYDTQNRVLTITEASGSPLARTTTFTYTGERKAPDTVVEQVLVGGVLENRTTAYTYNARNQVIQQDVSWSGQTRSTLVNYNAQALPESVSDAHTQTGFLYNASGQVSAIVEGAGTALERTTTLADYHANGQPTLITYPDGTTLVRSYSTMGKLISETVQGQTTSYTYDLAGLLTSITYPDGTSDHMSYSQSQALETIVHKNDQGAVAYTTALTRDGMNNVVGTTITRGTVVDWSETNVRNKIAKIATLTDANNNQSTFTYNGEGQPTAVNEPLGRTTTQSYDQLNRLKAQVLPNTGATAIGYGADDQVASASDARSVQTIYTYNGFGELTQLASPDRGTWVYTYNQGRLDTATDPRGVVKTYTYDALNRPTQVVFDTSGVASANQDMLYGGNQTQAFTYDSCHVGKLCSITDNQGSTSFAYDTQGRLVSTARSDVSLPSMSTSQTHDSKGRIATRTYPSGKVASYTYNPTGEIETITYDGQPVVAGATYNALGQVLTLGWGGSAGLGQAFTYDASGNMVQVDEPTTSIQITRDALSRPTLFTDTLGSTTQSHGYDVMNQVVSSEFSLWGTSKNYAYDLGGNLLSNLENTNSGSTASYAATSNRLSAIGTLSSGTPISSQPVVHDAMGSIHSVGPDTITYDATGRLSEWSDGVDTTKMYYNAAGQRVKKIVTGVNAGIFLEAYDSQGRLIGVYTPNGTGGLDVVEELVYLDGWRAVATIRPDASLGMGSPVVYPIVSDHLGSPRKILAQSGALMWSWTNTEPYGYQAPNELHSGSSFTYDGRFPGQRFDRSTGTLHNGFRTYSPKLGRYMQSDPLGLSAGWNTYAYVSNNPLGSYDPIGLSERDQKIIVETFNRTVESMTKARRRHPDPITNNMYGPNTLLPEPFRRWRGHPSEKYLDCLGQSDEVYDALQKIRPQLDDEWTFTTDSAPYHHWVVAYPTYAPTERNPTDRPIWMDPRANQYSIGKECPACRGYSGSSGNLTPRRINEIHHPFNSSR